MAAVKNTLFVSMYQPNRIFNRSGGKSSRSRLWNNRSAGFDRRINNSGNSSGDENENNRTGQAQVLRGQSDGRTPGSAQSKAGWLFEPEEEWQMSRLMSIKTVFK